CLTGKLSCLLRGVRTLWRSTRQDGLVITVATRRAQNPESREDGGEGERDDIMEVARDSLRYICKPKRPATAVHHHRIVTHVISAAAQHVDQEFLHVGAHQTMSSLRKLEHLRVEVLRHGLDGPDRRIQVELHVATQKIPRIEISEEDVAIGDRWHGPPQTPP